MGMVLAGLSCFGVLLVSETFASVGLVNGAAQLMLFIPVACIPAWRTNRMSYVDIAWPWGLALIGAVTQVFADSYPPRKVALHPTSQLFFRMDGMERFNCGLGAILAKTPRRGGPCAVGNTGVWLTLSLPGHVYVSGLPHGGGAS